MSSNPSDNEDGPVIDEIPDSPPSEHQPPPKRTVTTANAYIAKRISASRSKYATDDPLGDESDGEGEPTGSLNVVKEYVSDLVIPKHIEMEGIVVPPNTSFPPDEDSDTDTLDEEKLQVFDFGADDEDGEDNNTNSNHVETTTTTTTEQNEQLTSTNTPAPETPTPTTQPPNPPASGGESGLGQTEDARRQARLQALLLAHQAAALPNQNQNVANPGEPGYVYVGFMSKEWWGNMMKLTVSSYFFMSFLSVTLHTIHTSSYYNYQFYPSMVSLSSSKTMYLFLANFVISLMVFVYQNVISFFLGRMTHNEEQNIGDTLRYSITETCIALTMFREEVSLKMGLGFLLLLLNKCLHLAAKIRVEGLAQADELAAANAEVNAENNATNTNANGNGSPPVAATNHVKEKARLFALISILFFIDIAAINYYADSLLQHGASVSILFSFESVVLSISCYSTFSFLCLYLYEKQFYPNDDNETPTQQQQSNGAAPVPAPETNTPEVAPRAPKVFHAKSSITFFISFFFESLRFLAYIVFFLVVFTYYGLPLNIIRDLYLSFTSLRLKLKAFLTYRTLTSNMSARFPTATEEQLVECDHQCIICRDDMPEGRVLPCGHIFHFTCLRQWLQTSGTCPTCRAEIPLDGDIPAAAAPGVAGAAVAAPVEAGAAAPAVANAADVGVIAPAVENGDAAPAPTPAVVASNPTNNNTNVSASVAASSVVGNYAAPTSAVAPSATQPTPSTPSQPSVSSAPNIAVGTTPIPTAGDSNVDFQAAMQQQIQQQMMTTMSMMCSPCGAAGGPSMGIPGMPSTPLSAPSTPAGLFSPMMSPFAQQSNVKAAANIGPYPCLCRVSKSSAVIYSAPTMGDDSTSVRSLARGVTVVCIEKVNGMLRIPGGFVSEKEMEYLPVPISGGLMPGLVTPYNLMSPVVRGIKGKVGANTPVGTPGGDEQEQDFNRNVRASMKAKHSDEVVQLKDEVASLRAEVLKLSQSKVA